MFFPFEFLVLVALTVINVINNFKKFVLKSFMTFVEFEDSKPHHTKLL